MRSTSMVIFIIFVSIFLAGCGSPVEEPAPTAVPTDTPVPTQPPPPADTPTPMPEPTSTPIPITTYEDLAGQWTRMKQGYEWRLNIKEDGTASDWVQVRSWFAINLRLEDGLFYVNYESDSVCTDIGIYEVSGVPSEYLIFSVVEDACSVARGLRGNWNAFVSQ